MDWFSALLPVWIIGAPLVYFVFDWLRTPKSTSSTVRGYDVGRPAPTARA